ncbi:MAG: YfbM family protein [Pirellulales bacterium]
MGCLGVHFALTPDEATKLRSLGEDARLDHVREVIEEEYFTDNPSLLAESDKAWDALHRVLSDGELTWDGGAYPLNHAVLAGELLYTQPDYIMSLKTPTQVAEIAAAMSAMPEVVFRQRYFGIDPASYDQPLSEEDFGYTWEAFELVRDLYVRAAAVGRYVLFTADQ